MSILQNIANKKATFIAFVACCIYFLLLLIKQQQQTSTGKKSLPQECSAFDLLHGDLEMATIFAIGETHISGALTTQCLSTLVHIFFLNQPVTLFLETEPTKTNEIDFEQLTVGHKSLCKIPNINCRTWEDYSARQNAKKMVDELGQIILLNFLRQARDSFKISEEKLFQEIRIQSPFMNELLPHLKRFEFDNTYAPNLLLIYQSFRKSLLKNPSKSFSLDSMLRQQSVYYAKKYGISIDEQIVDIHVMVPRALSLVGIVRDGSLLGHLQKQIKRNKEKNKKPVFFIAGKDHILNCEQTLANSVDSATLIMKTH